MMLEMPMEVAGLVDVPAFGMAMWVTIVIVLAIIGFAVGVVVVEILLAPRMVRSWAREGLRRTCCG